MDSDKQQQEVTQCSARCVVAEWSWHIRLELLWLSHWGVGSNPSQEKIKYHRAQTVYLT